MSRRLPGVVLSEMAREVSHSFEPVQKLGCSSRRSVLPDGEHRDPDGSADLLEQPARVGRPRGLFRPRACDT